ASGNKQHRCPECQKTFARHEHMVRHLASHSSETSYECSECGKRFRRNDVLQRHQRLHQARIELSLDSADLSQRQRSALARVDAACQRCSSKKLKCDARRPACSRCARLPNGQCRYPAASTAAPTASSSQQLRRHSAMTPFPTFAASTPTPSSSATARRVSPAKTATFGLSATATDSANVVQRSPVALAGLSHQIQDVAMPQYLADATASMRASTVSLPSQHSGNPNHTAFLAPLASDNGPAMMPSTVPMEDQASLDTRTLTNLLGWLDGADNVDAFQQGQIDWVFGDSPDGTSTFNWDQVQMHPAIPYETASVTTGAAVVGPSQPAPIETCSPRLPSHEIQPSCALDMLSTAAQLHLQDEMEPASLSSAPQQSVSDVAVTLAAHQSDSEQPERVDVANPEEQGPSPLRLARFKETRNTSTAGRRSRWNSPEPTDEEAATSESASSDPSSSRPRDRDDVDDLTSRNHTGKGGSKRTGATMWPNRWNPDIKESVVPHFTFFKASDEHLMMEDMAHVYALSPAAKARIADSLRLAALSSEEEHRITLAFETVNAETLNLYLQLFFHHFYSFFPVIHRATFSPDRCDPRLLAALCSVGAFFSEVPGSRNAGIYLASLSQASLGHATHRNHQLARFTSSFQTFLLVFLIWRSIGVPSRQEHAEAFRSTYTTMIRRTRLLEDITPPRVPETADLQDRWMAWVSWEGGRRTAWSIFVSETELTSAWPLPSSFVSDEIRGQLPLDERLWEAPSAVQWAQVASMLAPPSRSLGAPTISDDLHHPGFFTSDAAQSREGRSWPQLPQQLTVEDVCRLVSRATPGVARGSSTSTAELEALGQLSPFSRLCAASALHLSTHHTLRMASLATFMFDDMELVKDRSRRVLRTATQLLSQEPGRDVRVGLLLHTTQLLQLVSIETLQTLSCRRGPSRMLAARKALQDELQHSMRWKVPLIIEHAGQILRLIKQSLKRTPTECMHLFYAGVSLHAVSMLILQKSTHGSSDSNARATADPINSMADFALSSMHRGPASAGTDHRTPPLSVSSTTSASSPTSLSRSTATAGERAADTASRSCDDPANTVFILESVGNLSHPLAARRILLLVARWLRDNDGLGVWPLARSLAKILDSLSSV
ncbi:hypothetical protein BCV70DRAFT_143852, partial [Testicularia cyperi]